MPDEPLEFWDLLPPDDDLPPPDWLDAPDLTPLDEADAEFAGLIQELASSAPLDTPEYVPGSLLERYLAAQPEANPDAAEATMRERAAALKLVDARFLALENLGPDGAPLGYEVGALEVFADPVQGAYSGRYLPVAHPDSLEALEAVYFPLQTAVEYGGVAPHALHHFAEFAADDLRGEAAWQEATPAHFAAYRAHAGLVPERDAPPPEAYADLLREGEALASPGLDAGAVFHALRAIGVGAADFDPDRDPPPYFDAETGTAYWVGVFQPDTGDPARCVTSILSLGRDPETGALAAQLAPCVPGDWDKAVESGQHLLKVMERDGIDACFLAAESMAIATDQRELWETARGVPTGPDYAARVADYAREAWEIEM